MPRLKDVAKIGGKFPEGVVEGYLEILDFGEGNALVDLPVEDGEFLHAESVGDGGVFPPSPRGPDMRPAEEVLDRDVQVVPENKEGTG